MKVIKKEFNLNIEKVATEGKGIAKKDNYVYFVEKGIPGDVVDVLIQKKKKDYAHTVIDTIIEPSKDRIQAFCEHFGGCGGCYWQHLSYEKQIEFKQQIVIDTFKKLANIDITSVIQPILSADTIQYYRNKMEYTFSDRSWLTNEQIASGKTFDRRALGFHVAGSFASVLPINKCFLQDDFANILRNFIYNYAIQNNYSFYNLKINQGFLRNLIIRNTTLDEWMLTLCFAENNTENIQSILTAIVTNFPQLNSVNYIINTKKNDTIFDQEVLTYYGKSYIIEQLSNIKFKISTKSFFQTNSLQATALYTIVSQFAEIKQTDIVYDLYCGTGSIGLFLAQQASKIIGIEIVADAIADANENAAINNIKNAKFHVGSVEKLLDSSFIIENGFPDIVILDPPRAGLHEQVIQVLLATKPKQIIYVSCNPATQARDILLLSEQYTVTKSQAVDMFPHTYHIENVLKLALKI